MQTIGERLKHIRTIKHLTQLDFGKSLGVTKQAIANIETSHSNPSIEFLRKLIENFGVNTNWLITGKGDLFIECLSQNNDYEFSLKVEEILRSKGLI